ncbi:Si-specific NAD(P)(+) transhydrogenase [Bythopirellula polymerisocia]|uniref:Soluble pyridine nucleotide transhydrogenase n=1 Tax=Bythopirellula polymerisocia TaxID=2528003 RepID=A0A5C6CHY4_9BACT|nr:Si-specific NAD(P)(+) transhydrogenase [Bythopirellula polymerisocia]TWU22836.1 Soluble pyridine nucleotide transhydrogenase [Bythopirellula polymerisocia]
MRHYDCIAIGTGPAGQKGAIQAAKLGKRVAIIEKKQVLGGAQINTGTIPSKALREAALHLTGASHRGHFGSSKKGRKDITVAELVSFSQRVIRHEWDVIRDQFDRNGIDLLWGKARFTGPNELAIDGPNGEERVSAERFLVAVGTKPARPDSVPFNGSSIFTSDEVLRLNHLPRTMIVVGGGVIGTEYACILATLGVQVTLVEGRKSVLGFLDQEIADAFQYFMRQLGITLRLGEKVERIEEVESVNGTTHRLVQAQLESGKTLRAQTLLYAVGRQGVCSELGLANVGIEFDDRERLQVNEFYQTNIEHVYAAGDVIGFPALASTSMEQGRRAICHAFGCSDVTNYNTSLFPYGIYAVPEISMVGKTEEQLTAEGIPYEAGIANYREIARGQILGDELGMLKMLIHQDTHKILGVHVIGTGATELVHIGQAVMALGGDAEFFVNNVFNFPTLAECYKVAAYNGLNKLNHVYSGTCEAVSLSL